MPVKPSEKEDEYFTQIEQEMKKRVEERKAKRSSDEERLRLKTLHFMKCPKCGADLTELDFKGVKIDECPDCRGMWLDQGEYDALLKIETPALGKLFALFKK